MSDVSIYFWLQELETLAIIILTTARADMTTIIVEHLFMKNQQTMQLIDEVEDPEPGIWCIRYNHSHTGWEAKEKTYCICLCEVDQLVMSLLQLPSLR